MMRTIRIKEHSSIICEDLELRPSDMGLASRLKDSMLAVREARRGIEISSRSHVGMARFSDFEVIVDPKIELASQNLPKLIAYALRFEDIKTQKGEAGFVPEDHYLLDVLIDFFAAGCRRMMELGLLKSYVEHRDDVPFLRGRLLLQRQLIHMVRKNPVFACEFDELEYDNLENRILLYCMKRCANITSSPRLKKDTTMLSRQLSGAVRHMEIRPEHFGQLQYTRLNQHYRALHKLAEMIINSTGMGDFSGQNRIGAFFVDANYIFERFVTRLFEEWHPCEAEPQKSRSAWTAGEKRLYIRPDIMLDSRIVVDAKYKVEPSQGDLYQVGFYIHEYGQKQGYMILPTHRSAKQEDIISERDNITVSIRTIDVEAVLNLLHAGEYEKIREIMLELVPVQ